MADIWRPQPKQAMFLERPEYEVLYGGSAGGGKSDASLMEALSQIHISHYKAVIFRKTYPQLTELIDRSMHLYKAICPTAKYNGSSHLWTFPTGSQIYFASMGGSSPKENQQGKAYDCIIFDELTHFLWEEYSYMFSRNRPTGKGTRVCMRATTNPGGVGHSWVKERWQIGTTPPMTTIWEHNKVPDGNGGIKVVSRDRIFVPATVFDNRKLLENDPNYIANLSMLDEATKNALLNGDWDSFSGQCFKLIDNKAGYDTQQWTNVVNPFRIPKEWKVIRAYDFGYTRPSACLWIAIVPHTQVKYVIREMYTTNGVPNQGNQMHHIDQARMIRDIEENDPNLRGRKITGFCDPAIFDESRGMSIANEMAKPPNYVVWQKGDHSRYAGKMQVHYHLAFNEDGYSHLYIFNSCKNTIRTIPSLVYDDTNVEDINTDGEDHIYDALRYGLMSNQIAPQRNYADKIDPSLDFDPLNQRSDGGGVLTFKHF